MRRAFHDLAEKGRIGHPMYGLTERGDRCGAFLLPRGGSWLFVIASDGADWRETGFDPPAWEHVSVTVKDEPRCPTWEEMAWVKGLFWDAEELVVQFHPPKSLHVNYHPTCLHLWRPVGVEIPLPPRVTLA